MNHQHFRKADGLPKVGFDTEEQALQKVNAAAGDNAYRCGVCQRWHVGHRPGSSFRRQRLLKRGRRGISS